MSLTLGLTAAIGGLTTAQRGLDLVSHNIANVNTEGYTRKIFNPESVVLAGKGSGVQVGSITRQVDQGLQQDLWNEGGTYQRLNSLDTYYSQMQELFGEPGANTSIGHIITRLGQELESLGVSPNSATAQNSTVDAAQRIAEKLNAMDKAVQDLRLRADKEIGTAVTNINSLLTSISSLNDKIVRSIATGQTGTADLQDKRDLAIRQLTEYMDVQSFERESGAMVVYSKGGSTLVDSGAVTLTHTALTQMNSWTTYAGNDINKVYINATDITQDFTNGRVKALIDMRDSILPDIQAEIDQLSVTMMDQANQVHNRGTNYPTMMTSYTGTTQFLGSATQTLTLSSGDVTLAITDTSGNQSATTTLDTIMQSATFGTGAQAAGGPWTINEIATTIQDWLQDAANGGPGLTGASVAVNADGKFAISLGTTTSSLYFRDESATAANSTHTDASIAMDWDADGTADETISGFANALGLNDLYTSGRKNYLWDSDIMTATQTIGTGGTLNFSDETNGLIFDTIAVNSTDTLQDIADRINADSVLAANIEAEVIPEGAGYRLRVRHTSGEEINVTQAGGTALISALGMRRSDVGQSDFIQVRSDIQTDPSIVSRGQLQYNTDLAEYYVSAGDNTNANAMADLLTNNVSFNLAGDMSSTARTFAGYAEGILALNATQHDSILTDLDYQKGLVERLDLKSAEISAVNLDEEISNLMIFEKSYAAAGKVISTIDRMLEILNSLI